MAQRIILALVCLLCAFPFYMLSWIGKDSRKPMHFRNGDEEMLTAAIRDVAGYNREMAAAYRFYSLIFLLCAVLCALLPAAGLAALLLQASLGLLLLWKKHRAIVKKYS